MQCMSTQSLSLVLDLRMEVCTKRLRCGTGSPSMQQSFHLSKDLIAFFQCLHIWGSTRRLQSALCKSA